MADEPVNQTKMPGQGRHDQGIWAQGVRLWCRSRPRIFWVYIVMSILLFIGSLFKITTPFLQSNLPLILGLLSIGILIVMVDAMFELVPQTKGLSEALADARRDEVVDSTLRGYEDTPPRTTSEVAHSVLEVMNVVSEQVKRRPLKRLIGFIGRLTFVLILLALIIKTLVNSSAAGRFGLGSDPSFIRCLTSSAVALVTFGQGLVRPEDFSDPSQRSLFLAGVTILSVSILGLGVSLLVRALDESSYISHLYYAIRTHLEVYTEMPDRLPRSGEE